MSSEQNKQQTTPAPDGAGALAATPTPTPAAQLTATSVPGSNTGTLSKVPITAGNATPATTGNTASTSASLLAGGATAASASAPTATASLAAASARRTGIAGRARENLPNVKVTPFYGEPGKKDGRATCLDFLESIDRAARQNGWTDMDAAECAYENLQGNAKRWASRLQRSMIAAENAIVTDWRLMRSELAKRFNEVATPAQKVNAISNISQAQGESAKDYYDRIRAAFDFLVREEFTQQPPVNWQGYMACFENIFKTFYLKGLETRTRTIVAADLGSDVGLTELVERVEQVDQALQDEKRQTGIPHQIAGIGTSGGQKEQNPADEQLKKAIKENKELQAKIAAMSGSRQGNRDNPSDKKKDGRKITDTPMKERGWIFCFKCNTWGQHIKPECNVTQEQKANLPKENGKERPTGKAFDRQFNTQQD